MRWLYQEVIYMSRAKSKMPKFLNKKYHFCRRKYLLTIRVNAFKSTRPGRMWGSQTGLQTYVYNTFSMNINIVGVQRVSGESICSWKWLESLKSLRWLMSLTEIKRVLTRLLGQQRCNYTSQFKTPPVCSYTTRVCPKFTNTLLLKNTLLPKNTRYIIIAIRS